MTKADLQKFEIIKSLWKIVKLANNTDIAAADLSEGIADGETPEENVEEIVKDFKRFFGLYAVLTSTIGRTFPASKCSMNSRFTPICRYFIMPTVTR